MATKINQHNAMAMVAKAAMVQEFSVLLQKASPAKTEL